MASKQISAHVLKSTSFTLPVLGLHVLVAEDNLINQAILREQLEALGCSVVLVGNGLQAMQIWDQEHFDVVLSDVNMPVLNGYELARLIRAKSGDVPIIGITANEMRDEGERCQTAGMSSWMVKPLSLTDLLDALVNVRGVHKGDDLSTSPLPLVVQHSDPQTVILSDSMRRLFRSAMLKDMEAVRAAVASGSQADAVQVLHSISGALSVVRADELAGIFGRMEHTVRRQKLDSLSITEINQTLDRLSDLLKSL